MVARMYEIGYIVEPDINEALKWYTEAANAGEPHAQQRLKTLFDEGR
jgi:TPR repeat protein